MDRPAQYQVVLDGAARFRRGVLVDVQRQLDWMEAAAEVPMMTVPDFVRDAHLPG